MTEPRLTVADVLGPGGAISRRLSGYEPRAEQLEMAQAVERAIENRTHLIAEAGTGVGKSFAYLIPAILAAQSERSAPRDKPSHGGSNSGSQSSDDGPVKRRVIVSTHTISLQEQLIQHDVPFLQAVLPVEFSAVLVKGRGNYISLRRLERAVQRSGQRDLFDGDGQRQLQRIRQWALETRDGSRSDLPFQPQSDVWDEVLSDHGDCLRRKCPRHADCFYFAARRRVWNADLLIVNHALFFADLALRRNNAAILPDYETVIFDEAHTVESVAADHLGLAISEGQIEYLFNKLYQDQQQRGLLHTHGLKSAQKLVLQCRNTAATFFSELEAASATACRPNGRLIKPLEVPADLSQRLGQLSEEIGDAAEAATSEATQVELKSAADRCAVLAGNLKAWLKQSVPSSVYWIERAGSQGQRLSLQSAPVEVGPLLRDLLYNNTPSVIMASATLATGHEDFRFFRSRIGLTSGNEVRLGSPFNYRRQARLILATGIADPAADPRAFETQCCERIRRHVLETAGRAFVLFTSYSMMQACAQRLTGWFASNNLSLYCQGTGLPRSAMLERFRNDPRAVLFGTDSFWQGVNVPGDALQNVIIPKLPFSVPDHPLLEARLELIRSRGGNPFRDYQTPEAIIKLKQGFGRLIRHRNDSGRVVILDPRLLTKPYGRLFIQSLPECRLEVDNGESIEPFEDDL
ncbi:MAG: helicase [Planctomycetota bacterium]|jgi:ATP-dependent DNA helicase DinG